MRITAFETFRCKVGWRSFSYLKLSTDAGIVGWSEFVEGFGNAGVSEVISTLATLVIGRDPRRFEEVTAYLQMRTRQAPGGLNHHAIGAIENALLDIAGKAYGLPVHALFGGPIRERIPVYWSRFGTLRISFADHLGVPRLETYDDLAHHAEAVRALGFDAIKTHIHPFVDGRLGKFDPGFGVTPGWPELNPSPAILDAMHATLGALRAGAGDDCRIMLDLNFGFRTEGFLQVARAVAPYRLDFLELDTNDPTALAAIRRQASCPIAALETMCHRRAFRPFLEAQAVDIAVIDISWNGFAEALKIAAMADAYEVNCAPHNSRGRLGTAMAAHFAAVIPNFRILEFDLDDVPWSRDLCTWVPDYANGTIGLPQGAGWGVVPDEAALHRHAVAA